MDMKTLWVAVLGVAFGAGGAVGTRAHWEGVAQCKTGCKTAPPAPEIACPAHYEKGKIAITDVAEAERVRTALMNGVIEPWFDLGRAPTPDEVGQRLRLDGPATGATLDKLAACGKAVGFGVHRVPESDLLAIAWPLANVPTGIEVTLEGKKPVHARCAVDALGISKMMGRRAVVEAVTRDGVALRVEVDGDRLVSMTPSEAVVLKGESCDEMLFFSSQAALDVWKKERHIEGRAFKMEDAVKHGAELFGIYAQPIRG